MGSVVGDCRDARGRRWLWYLTGLAILLFGGRERLTAIASAGSAALVGVGVFTSIKKLSGRKRPCEIEPHCWATLLPPDQFSFPSGHTITAFAVALGMSVFYPILTPLADFCGSQHCDFAHFAGHAFSERRGGGRDYRHWVGADELQRVYVVQLRRLTIGAQDAILPHT